MKPFYPTVKKLWKCEDECLQEHADDIVTSLGIYAYEIMGDDVDELIEMYLNGEDPHLICKKYDFKRNMAIK